MTVVTVSYILFAPEGLSLITVPLFGFAIDYWLAIGVGVGVAAVFASAFYARKARMQKIELA